MIKRIQIYQVQVHRDHKNEFYMNVPILEYIDEYVEEEDRDNR